MNFQNFATDGFDYRPWALYGIEQAMPDLPHDYPVGWASQCRIRLRGQLPGHDRRFPEIRHMKLASLFLLILLSGCLNPGTSPSTSPQPTWQPKTCEQTLCLADPSNPDAQYVLQNLGLHQITDGPNTASWLSFRDGLLAMTLVRVKPEVEGHALYAYDLKTESATRVWDQEGHVYVPTSDGSHILYNLVNNTFDGAIVWNTSAEQVIKTRPEGAPKAEGFEYPWVIFANGFSQNKSEDGYWAYNLQDQRRVFLYHPLPQRQFPDGSYQTLIGAEVANATAVYILSRATPENQTPTRYNFTVYTVNLETGERQEYYNSETGANRLKVDWPYVAIAANLEAWSLNLKTGKFTQHTRTGEAHCGFPSVGGTWMAFGCTEIPTDYILMVNASSGDSFKIRGPSLFFYNAVTDGEYVVVKAQPRDEQRFMSFNMSLYWARIEEIRTHSRGS